MIHLQFSWSYCHLVEDQGALFTQQKDREKKCQILADNVTKFICRHSQVIQLLKLPSR